MVVIVIVVLFFFFKQKTAYEMRISDWSSDVCSSPADRRARGAGMSVAGKTILYTGAAGGLGLRSTLALLAKGARGVAIDHDPAKIAALTEAAGGDEPQHREHGRAACRGRVWQSV